MRDAELVDMAVGGGDTLVTVASPISRRAAPAAPPTSIAHPWRLMHPAAIKQPNAPRRGATPSTAAAAGRPVGCAARARSHHLIEQVEHAVLQAMPAPAPPPGLELEARCNPSCRARRSPRTRGPAERPSCRAWISSLISNRVRHRMPKAKGAAPRERPRLAPWDGRSGPRATPRTPRAPPPQRSARPRQPR